MERKKENKMTNVDFYLFDLKSKFKKINPNEYYLAYSGGKDSHLLYWFLKVWLQENDFEMWLEYRKISIVAVNTYMEFPEISDRMKKYADVILVPKMKPHEVIANVGTPCFGKNSDEYIARYQHGSRSHSVMKYINKSFNDGYTMFGLNQLARDLLLQDKLPKIDNKCCYYLKKEPFKHYEKESYRKPILGIMASESRMRQSRYKSCFTKDRKFTPIWDLTEDLSNEIYKQYNIELPSIYQFINQTGCAGCPYGIGLHHTETELQLMTPAKRKYVERLFGAAYEVRGLNYKQTSIYDFIKKEE